MRTDQIMGSSSFTLPSPPAMGDLAELASSIERQRHIIDARLHRPALWRGLMRREVHGYDQSGERSRYVQAYNHFVSEAVSSPQWKLDAALLCAIHDAAVGGAEFRNVGLLVGAHHRFPAADDVPALVDAALARASASHEPTPVVATRLHLDLLTIHPFRDGNGRTSRLVATLWLVRAGFRSSLLTTVEQHFHPHPRAYIEILDQYRYGEIKEDCCVAYLLQAMISNSMYATWFREREERLYRACAHLSIPTTLWDDTLTSYDTETALSGWAASLLRTIGDEEPPLHILTQSLTMPQRTELAFQVERLLDEEQEEATHNALRT